MSRVVFVDTRFYKDLSFLDKINLKEGDYAFIPVLNRRQISMFAAVERSYEVGFCFREELRDVDSFIGDAAYSLLEMFANKCCSIEIITQDIMLWDSLVDMHKRLPYSSSSLCWLNRSTRKRDVSPKERETSFKRREDSSDTVVANLDESKITLDKSGVTFNTVNIFNYNLTKLKSQYGKVTKASFEKYIYYFAMNFIKTKNVKEFYDLIGLVSDEIVKIELLEDFLKTVYDCHGEELFDLIKSEYAKAIQLIY